MNKKISLFVILFLTYSIKSFGQCYSLPSYCTPTFANVNSFSIGLQNVTLGSTINNSTSATGLAPNYFDYTSMSVSAAAGGSISFSIQNGSSNSTGARIFIDYNQDGTFSTSSPELVWSSGTSTPSAVVTGSFTVPSGQAVGAYRIRVTGDIGGSAANTCTMGYGEVEDYTLVVTSSTTDGLAMGLTAPTRFVLGSNTISFMMANLTNSSVSSVDIGYQLGSNTPVTQSLSSLSIGAGGVYTATFSTALSIGSTGTYNLKVWINNVNGSGTVTPSNDTLCKTFIVCPGLSGNYTIDPAGSGSTNFKRFGEADTALINCGVSGKVVFKVASGTYTQQVSFPNNIPGMSAANSVTFQSASGNASDVILTFSSNSAAANYTLRLDGASFFKFKDMTISATNTNFGTALAINTGSHNDSFFSVRFNGISTRSTSTNLAVIFAPSNAVYHYPYFGSCTINNGSYGAYMQSSGTNTLGASTQNLTFVGCDIRNQYAGGLYNSNLDGLRLINNKISTDSTYTAYMGMYNYWIMILDDTKRPIITGNKITGGVGGTGMYNQYFGVNSSTITPAKRGIIANNMIQIGAAANSVYGLRDANDYGSDYIHNTVNIGTTQNTNASAAAYFENVSSNTVSVQNNIFSGKNGGPAVRTGATITNFTPWNFNNLYSAGSNLAYLNTTGYTTLANWRTASSKDANSANTNPSYVSGTDLHLTGAPILVVPVNALVPTDIDNQSRCSITDIGADYHPGNDDIGISRVIHPNNGIAGSGSRDVVVVIKNYGGNTVTSANVSYRDNSITRTIAWSGSLGTCDSAVVTFTGSNQYTFSAGWSLRFFTSSPNGNPDSYIPNDTIRMTNGCVGLYGNYTINPSGSGSTNFTSFANAINAMTSCGIASPVVFTVAAGTYTEQLSIPAINGASSVNTITFDGGAGNTTSRILTFGSTSSGSPHVLRFNGCNYVQFKNMTIQGTSTTDAWVVHFLNGTNNRITNCVVEISGSGASASASNLVPVVINGNASTLSTATTTGMNHTVDSCTINAGYYGIYISVNATDNLITIRKNSLNQAYLYGSFASNTHSLRYINNSITLRTTVTSSISAYFQNMNNTGSSYFEVSGNKTLNPGQIGLYFASCSNSGSAFNKVYNNMVGGSFRYAPGTYGIYLTSCQRFQVYHNSVNLDIATTGTSAALYVTGGSLNDIRNNHLAVTNPASISAFNLYLSNSTVATNVDYNNYFNRSTSSILYIGGPSYEIYNFKAAFPNGGGLNSVSGTPEYAGATDLHSSAPCFNAPSLGITTDIDGQTRASMADFGADEVTGIPNNDIGVTEILTPSFPITSGTQSIKVVIKNFGANAVTSANVNYIINSGSTVTESWSGNLGTCDTAHVIFSSTYSFPTGSSYIEVFTSSPNGNTDPKVSNDSVRTSLCTAMSGSYTINPSGSGSTNFTSFRNAVDALACSGISGPIRISVVAGTYNEQVSVPPIKGTSATNTIVFDGGAGNAASRVLTFATTTTSLYVLQLKACSYVTFRNLTIRSTGTNAGWVAHMMDGTNNRISNCIIEITGSGATFTGTNLNTVVVNGSSLTLSTQSFFSDNNMLDSNVMNAGYYNIYAAFSAVANKLIVKDNVLNNSYFYGIFANGNFAPKITGNTLNLRTTVATNYGIYIQNCNNTQGNSMEIVGNKVVNTGQYGIYLTSCSKSGTDFNLVANNMIGNFRTGNGSVGIYMTSVSRTQVFHNSIDLNIATLITGTNAALFIQNGSGNDVRNNHLAVTNPLSQNAFPVWITPSSAVATLDNNNYYNTSSPFLVNIANVLNASKTYANAYPNGGGTGSISYNPFFVSATDLHSTNTCNAGRDLTAFVPRDIDGSTRSTTPDIGADEVTSVQSNDMGVYKINGPVAPLATGTASINVTLKNYGSNTITSATIAYILNGGTPVTQSWTGSLAACDTVNFVFSTTATIASGANSLMVYTSSPNSNTDPVQLNDTSRYNLCEALSGIYTIGPGKNFTGFSAAVNAMNCGGVKGKVTFNVDPGSYYEQVFVSDLIAGVSAANTVTFQSSTGNPNDVSLTYSGTAARNYTLQLFNANYFKFKDMTIGGINTTNGTALSISYNSSYDSFVNVIFNGITTTTNNTNLAVISCPNGASNFIYFDNCQVNNGAYGTYFISNGNSTSTENLTLVNCTFSNQYVYGMFHQNLLGLKLIKNKVRTNSTLTTYTGIYNNNIAIITDAHRPLIIGNRIWGAVSGTGLYNIGFGINSTATLNRRPIVANNMIQIGSNSSANIGIRDNNTVSSVLYLNNSVNVGGTSTANTSAAGYFESTSTGNVILNNSFTGYAGNPAIRVNTIANYRSNYNNLFTTGGTLAYQNTTARATLALWKTNTVFHDSNSVNVNPIHTSNFDLHSNQSAMDNAGTITSFVTDDYDGMIRCPNTGCPGGSGAPDIGADEFQTSSLDVTVANITGPVLICPNSGGYSVTGTIKNLGTTTLTSATVNWSVNGVTQTPFSWTGSLAQNATSASITIGSYAFGGGVSRVRVWTTAPNGSADQNTMNDTMDYIPPSTLKGIYTVGGVNPDFYTVSDAVNALNARGVCGPVTFNIRQGTYGGRIQLNTITGSSAANFITFRPDPSNTAPVELTVDGNSATADNHTIFLNGTSFVAFRELKITNTSLGSGSFGSVIRFAGAQDSIVFVKNIITGPITTNTSTNFAVFNHTTGSTAMINRCVVDSNTIANGSYGIYLYGNTNSNATTFEFRNRIRHNQITGAYYRGIDAEFQRRLDIVGNKVWLSPVAQTGSSGIYTDYIDSFRIERNNVNYFGQYGIYLSRANYQFGGGSYRSTLQNNMVGGRSTGTSPYGIYMNPNSPGIHYMDIYHNSVSVTSTATGSAFFVQQTTANTYSNLEIKNNSFANFGSGTYTCYFYCNPVITNMNIDYNNYYTANANNLIFVIGNSGYTAATGGSPTYNSNSLSGNPGYANNATNLHAVRPQLDNKGTFIATCAIDIDGQSRPLAPSTIVDIGADEFYPPFIDIGVGQLNPPDICANSQNISVRVDNFATKTIDSFRINWSVNGVIQSPKVIPTTLTAGNSVNVTLTSTPFTFVNNTTYNFRFWTYRPNGLLDSVPDNDTLTTSFQFLGNAPAPTTFDAAQCGMGKPILKGLPPTSADSLSWYTAASGGTYLGMGNTITGPFINQTTTFYAQSIRLSKAVRFGPVGNTAVNVSQAVPYGGMFNVTMTKTVMLDSMLFRLWYNVPNTGYTLYYKTGTFNGNETNPAAWTLVNSGQVTYFNYAGYNWGRVSTKGMFLQAGQTYSFYFASQVNPTYPTGNVIYSMSGGGTVTNTEMTIQGGGSIIIGAFGATQVLANWHPEMTFVYKNLCQGGTRSPIKITVKSLPTSDVAQGTPFQGQWKAGIPAQPDVLEVGKTNVYELVAPVGYTNAGHGTTWAVTNIDAKTAYGVTVPMTEYDTIIPSAAGPGKLILKPTSAFLDSLITFTVKISDFGPNFCDSFVKRSIMVAPTPKTNFKYTDTVCLGETVNFENLTTIHSGNATYKWYFGNPNNDSSDLQNTDFTYASPGTYNVRLVATSTPWGVMKDTVLKVFITDVPKVKFKVINQCEGIPVQFQNQSTVAGVGTMKYTWKFGDNTATSTATNPTHLYTVPDGYKVTLSVNFNGCIVSLTKNAYQFPRPDANFTVPSAPVCTKTDLTLANTSTQAWGTFGSKWSFGDGDIYTMHDGVHAYDNSGTYNVKLLTVSEFDCKDSITLPVVIKVGPKPDFSGNQFCSRTPTSFTNLTSETLPNPVYNWTISDGYTSSLKNISHSWANEGKHTVTLKATFTNGCSESVTKEVNVVIQPKADFKVTDICSGETANFVNTTIGDKDGIVCQWDFGNGTGTDHSPRRLYNPATTTIYTVQLVAAYPNACTDTVRKNLTVNEQPVCDFSIQNLGFMNTKFTPVNGTYNKYEWFFGDGGTSASVAPTYQYSTMGVYDITLMAESGSGCKCTMTKRMTASTGVNQVNTDSKIKVYPNPNNGVFTISNGWNTAMQVEVYSVTGSKVLSTNSEANTATVDLGDVAEGVYFVKVTTAEGNTETFRIAVVR